MQNKKIVNVKNGENNQDVVTKKQLDSKTVLLDGARTHGYIVPSKCAVYSQSGSLHATSFYLKDINEDEVRILTDNQDFDNVHLYVPYLGNADGFGNRPKSEILVSSVRQIITAPKIFRNYCTAIEPINSDHICTKGYVDSEIAKIPNIDSTQFIKKLETQYKAC